MSGRWSCGLIHIRIGVDPHAMPIIMRTRDIYRMTAGHIWDYDSMAVCEQMPLSFPREDLDQILRDTEMRQRP